MQGGKKQDVEEAAEASIYCVLGAASFASQGPTNKKGGEAAEEGAAARGRVKREGGGAGGAAGCRSKSRSSSENVENFLIKVDSCMSIGTKCWPSKGASFVGSSRYATISLAIEVAPPPPPPVALTLLLSACTTASVFASASATASGRGCYVHSACCFVFRFITYYFRL